MSRIHLSPETRKRLARFRRIKRGYYSFLIFIFLIVFSLVAELFINNRAIYVRYNGKHYFPTYGGNYQGKEFGLDYEHETNYRELQAVFANDEGKNDNFVIMPFVPYSAFEIVNRDDGTYPPYAPSYSEKHLLGTDSIGRDLLARLVYGFRIAIFFSLLLLFLTYTFGTTVGIAMGYYGGWLDLLFQRVIEIWTNVPSLYVIIIVSSLIVPSFLVLATILAIFGWTFITWYVRTITYREKARDYCAAARASGASDVRIMLSHILPNAISIIVTFVPFAISAGITSLTALDYLGFGLPPPTPSWGELLRQGMERLDASWIFISVITVMVAVLTMVTFVGEAVREAFDPKKYTVYE